MTFELNPADRQFLDDFTNILVPLSGFTHRAHIRLAWICLQQNDGVEAAVSQVRRLLTRYIAESDVPASKYHETLTRAWVLAVRRFIRMRGAQASSDAFIDACPELLDSKIMMTHYTPETLFSDAARNDYVVADIEPITA